MPADETIQVSEAHRRNGIGVRLVMLLELIAKKYKMKFVKLTTFKFNVNAMVSVCDRLL